MFNCLTLDDQLPVKVEAAVALQYLIKNQADAEAFIQPHVKPIIKVSVGIHPIANYPARASASGVK